MTSPTMAEAVAARDAGMAQVEANSTVTFLQQARDRVLVLLGDGRGQDTCENLVDDVKAAGIVPHNDRAFGPVFAGLAKDHLIKRVGFAPRRKGHAAPGASIWALAV